jgi:hypothetical protein
MVSAHERTWYPFGTRQSRKPTPPAGFEPATIGLEVRCSVH